MTRLWMVPVLACLVIAGCGRDEGDEEEQAATLRFQDDAEIASALGVDTESRVQDFLDEILRAEVRSGLPPGSVYSSSTYDDGSPLAEGFLNDGEPIGHWRYWHPNGRLSMAGEYRYGGIEHGEWKTWTPTGQRTSEGRYHEGQEVGLWQYWYASGRPSMRGTFALGQRHGEWTSWHSTGAMASRGEYIRDHQAGLWRLWDRAGKPLKPIFYHDVPPLSQAMPHRGMAAAERSNRRAPAAVTPDGH